MTKNWNRPLVGWYCMTDYRAGLGYEILKDDTTGLWGFKVTRISTGDTIATGATTSLAAAKRIALAKFAEAA